MDGIDLSARLPVAPDRTPLEDATDCLALGFLVIDAHLRVIGANVWARELLSTRDPFIETRLGMVARTTRETAALRNALDDCASGPQALRFSRSAPHRPIDSVVSRIDPVRVLLLLRDPEQEHDIAPATLSRLYGLTASEADFARELVRGHSVESAAAVRGISVQTARTHLKRVFLKTETNRQAQLIAELLRGPAALLRSSSLLPRISK